MYKPLPPVFIGPVMEHPELEGMFYTIVNNQVGLNQRVETVYLFKGRSDAMRFRMQFTRLVVNAQYNGHLNGHLNGHSNTSILNLEKDQYEVHSSQVPELDTGSQEQEQEQ